MNNKTTIVIIWMLLFKVIITASHRTIIINKLYNMLLLSRIWLWLGDCKVIRVIINCRKLNLGYKDLMACWVGGFWKVCLGNRTRFNKKVDRKEKVKVVVVLIWICSRGCRRKIVMIVILLWVVILVMRIIWLEMKRLKLLYQFVIRKLVKYTPNSNNCLPTRP